MKRPRFVVSKHGGKHFYFEVPKKQRPKDWPATIRLPDDPAQAVIKGRELNAKLDDVRARRAAEGYAEHGTLAWLMDEWRNSPDWSRIKPKTQSFYEDGWRHIKKWADRNNRPHAARIQWPTIYKLVTVYADQPGTQRQVINVLQRLFQIALDRGVITENPWADQKQRRWQSKKAQQEKQTIGYQDVVELVALCDAKGFPSMGTAVMVGFDLLQYPEDIIGMRFGEHYDAARGVFAFDRAKTGLILGFSACGFSIADTPSPIGAELSRK